MSLKLRDVPPHATASHTSNTMAVACYTARSAVLYGGPMCTKIQN